MCGIAGFTGQYDVSVLEDFQRGLHHRGPDEQGLFHNSDVGLTNTRLSIIDLAGGHQPIFNETGDCAIVFNGEIYNYRELRSDLLHRHRFTTESDTEVILHLYEEKGTHVSEWLKGDFAFCIWDSHARQCFLSRDPLGVKPLFYCLTESGQLVFASELVTLLRHPDVPTELDPEAVAEYLSCLYVAAPRSLIRGVRKLGPGESLIWENGSLRSWRYWPIPGVDPGRQSPQRFRDRALEMLRGAVQRRLIADVSVGAFLSGGLDSSLIVALASQEHPGLQTFSIGYHEADFDELKFARQVSVQYKTEHHEFFVKPEAQELIEEVIAAMDEPIADSSAIPTFLVARETRRFVKVALSGIGGDELFGGYPRYLGAKLSQRMPAALSSVITGVSGLFGSRPSGRDMGGWIRRFGRGVGMEPWSRYWHWVTFLDQQARERLFALPGFRTSAFERDAARCFEENGGEYLDRIFRFDVNRYLASDLLKFGDNMTMANSLELRVPFCDVDLVTEAAQTPSEVRFPGYRLKSVLRAIARNYLPADIVDRKKQGFMIPIGRWFRGELRGYLSDHLLGDRLPAFLDRGRVAAILDAHIEGRENHTHVLWAVLVLTRWLELHPRVRVPSVARTTSC